ncbi:MAG: DUF192 domain-containing protein [Caulobacteraceae bacterium]|nr:DUF192 domain-containing protein [Caulobacteraceae bacterium]
MTAVSLGRRALLSLALACLSFAPALAACPQPPQSLRTEPMAIVTHRGVIRLTVEIADTDQTREIGLMCRRSLAPSRGMLFDFRTVQPSVSFWMRNTLIPLDMVFIAADGRVVSVASNAVPLDETPINSGGPVLGVLEIGGGRAAALGIAPGDKVRERIFQR